MRKSKEGKDVFTNRKMIEFQAKMDERDIIRKQKIQEIKEKTKNATDFRREKLLDEAKAVIFELFKPISYIKYSNRINIERE